MPQVSTRIRGGLPSFFKPSRGLVGKFLSLIPISRSHFTNEELHEKAERDISLRLWRYLGTLARDSAKRNADQEVSRQSILEAMSVRFSLPRDSEQVIGLWEEFDSWLQDLEDSTYYAQWGEIRRSQNGVLVKGLPIDGPKFPKRDYKVHVYKGLNEEEFLKRLAPE